ncbi:MAG: 50S ribosomal protein L20 [SAR202 cluster bacterium]|nr:50S ribosomal protein L20 [SAR202 cluster bacterium]
MTRIRGGVTRRRRHKKILGMTKGHQGVRHRLFRRANESMLHAQQYAFDHRRQKKGEMRRLWNIRINAAARANGISYSKLIHGLNLAGIEINRKMLSELAVADGQAFAEIVQHAQSALEQQAA